jgi:hypothetical protein
MQLIEILNTTENLNHFDDRIGTDKNTAHKFVSFFYETEFKKYKNKKISLLEIGINGGGSLYLWGKYFEDGNILGIDIVDKIQNQWKGLSNVKYLIDDAYDPNISESLQKFDIIIDDGPHSLESQILCIKQYLNKLNTGGILIIEDIQNPDYVEILKNATPIDYHDKIEIVDLRSITGRYDDILFIIRN